MSKNKTYRIGEAAKIARMTVRALQHYDAIGLLSPSFRSKGEYRHYTDDDLKRLHLIRLYRELRLPLAEIQTILDGPEQDGAALLFAHRQRLSADVAETKALIAKIDRALNEDSTMTIPMRFEGFSHGDHEEEAEQRWGETSAWKTSQRRVAKYSKAEMDQAQGEHESLLGEFAGAMASGAAADSPLGLDLAERARLHIDRWYYDLTREGHAQLAQLYRDDPKFQESYERVAPGLAEYVATCIEANAAR